MTEYLLAFDKDLFYTINNGFSNSFFDVLMPFLREKTNWIPLYVLIIFYLIKTYKLFSFVAIVSLLITFGISDFTSSKVIKPTFARIRPCNDPEMTHVRLLVNCGSGKSFTSSHAANHFSIAVFLILLFYKRHSWILPVGLFWAFSISFAQIYVGVHYPLDISGGALLGTIVAFILYLFTIKLFPVLKLT